jgi:predicted ATP-grasp superfamily ATP-dependent carboligase
VLILDEVHDRPSLAAARALAARGWTVAVGGAERSLAARAKEVSAWHQIADAHRDAESFVDGVERVVRAHGYEAVFPAYEPAIVALSAQRDRLGVPLGYGPHFGVLTAIDKWRLRPLAAAAGLAVPRTVPATAEGLDGLDGRVVVKPASPSEARMAAAAFSDRPAALAYAYRIEQRGGSPIAQEMLDGRLAAVSLVAGPDGIVSIAQQLAEHAWPRPIGVTARGRTVPVDPALRTAIERLLVALEWQGLAQLQFLVPADGRPRLIDFNPRFYGSILLAVTAGADHPDTWARLITGRPVGSSEARPGVVYQWFSRDLRASLADRHPLRETVRCLTICPTAAHTLWNRRDPTLAPSFLAEQAGRAIRRRVAREPDNGVRSARLHGVEPSPEVLRALRTRRLPPWPERARQRVAIKRGALSYEEDWLAPLQAARRVALGRDADGPPRFLVRVDEFPYATGYDDPRLGYDASLRFHAAMAQGGVEYLLAVVPQWTHEPLRPDGNGGRPLDDRDREFLERMRREGVAFAQHGATHRTRYSSPRRRSELGGLDSGALAALLDDGRRRLEAEGIHPRVLVPPFNTFDAGQWSVIASRYDVITGGPESVLRLGFHGGPQWRGEAVYVPCYAPLYERASVALGAAERLIAQQVGTWVPIVLHMAWEVDDDFSALARFARRIAPYAASWDDFLRAVDASRDG